MWQKCPICNGDGEVETKGVSSTTKEKCPTCLGERIIGIDGKPPIAKRGPFNDLPIYYWNGNDFKKIEVERGKPAICDEVEWNDD